MDRTTPPSSPRPGAGAPAARRRPPEPDSNEAQWLDLGHTDQAFEAAGAVIEDSSLGLTLTDAIEPAPEGRAPAGRPDPGLR